MIVLKIDEGRVMLVRNKRSGKILIAKRVFGVETMNRCCRCALKYNPVCNPLDTPKNPCDDFLPDYVFLKMKIVKGKGG